MDPVILEIGDLVPFGELWGTTIGFVLLFCAVILAMGFASRTLTIGVTCSYLAFATFAMKADVALLETLLYVTLTLVIVGSAFKLWRLEGFETGS